MYLVTLSFGLLYLKRVALFCLHLFLQTGVRGCLLQDFCFLFEWCACGPHQIWRMALHFHWYCLEDSYDVLLNFGGPQGIEPVEEVLGNFYKMLKRLWEPGIYVEFCAQGSESVSPFHLFHLFIDWSELVGSLWLLVCWGCVFGAFLLLLYVADQSLRSSCLPMTTLAQLHDWHSCNDERSIVQKKQEASLGRFKIIAASESAGTAGVLDMMASISWSIEDILYIGDGHAIVAAKDCPNKLMRQDGLAVPLWIHVNSKARELFKIKSISFRTRKERTGSARGWQCAITNLDRRFLVRVRLECVYLGLFWGSHLLDLFDHFIFGTSCASSASRPVQICTNGHCNYTTCMQPASALYMPGAPCKEVFCSILVASDSGLAKVAVKRLIQLGVNLVDASVFVVEVEKKTKPFLLA